jgi:hypothetical protein
VYFACFVTHRLAHGERGIVLVLAMSREQAKVVFGCALAFLRQSPVLSGEIVEATRNEIRLRNGVVIAIHTNSFPQRARSHLVGRNFRRSEFLAR